MTVLMHPAQAARPYLVPPSEVKSKEWGKTNHELSLSSSACSGPWNTELIPHLRFYLDLLDDDSVREVDLQKATQEAGSETTLVWLKRVAVEDPGPAMWVFADEATAKRFCKTRILPAFRSCPAIAPLIDEKNFGQGEIILKNGFSLIMTWASSIPITASISVRYLILDEICKPAYYMTQREGNVIRRIEQRTNRFPNRKVVKLSSVTYEGDNMAQEMGRTDAAFDYLVPCPHCGDEQPLSFFGHVPELQPENEPPKKDRGDLPATQHIGRVVFKNEGTDQERAASARYECRSCKGLWTTAEKNKAVSVGRWVPRPGSSPRPLRAGLFVSRLISLSHGGRLETLVEDFLLARKDLEDLRSFWNNALALHWKDYKITSSVEELMKSKCEVPAGIVPDAADCIVISVDMQQTGFWYVVRAWASRLRESWLVECGQIPDWDDLDELIWDRTWPKNDGSEIGCWRAALDCGGTKEEGKDISRTEEAQEWWIRNRRRARRRVFLCKGSSRALPTKLSIGKILETTPSGKKIAHAGLQIIEVNTKMTKDLFFHALDRAKMRESRAAWLNAGTPDAYFRHLTAEAKGEDGTWKRIGRDNHYLDCEQQGFAIISRELYGGIDALARSLGPIQPPPPPGDQAEAKAEPPQPEAKKPPEMPRNPYIRRFD